MKSASNNKDAQNFENTKQQKEYKFKYQINAA
jgi:hypothetical protein